MRVGEKEVDHDWQRNKKIQVQAAPRNYKTLRKKSIRVGNKGNYTCEQKNGDTFRQKTRALSAVRGQFL